MQFYKTPIDQIHIKPNRQRKDLGDLSSLKTSILQVGLLNPIIIERRQEEAGYWLIAGERRFTAWSQLVAEGKISLTDGIPAREMSELSEPTKQIIELEENIKRKDLSWQEQVSAIAKVYDLCKFSTTQEAGDYLGLSDSSVSRALQLFNNLGNERVASAPNASAAYTIVQRENARALDNMSTELDSFFKTAMKEEILNDTPENPINRGTDTSLGNSEETPISPKPSSPAAESSRYQIQQGDFLSFAKSYNGKPFDLLHLDFPYGINHDRSQQGHTASYGTYEDSEDIYKTLVLTLLENQDRLVADKAHCICWLSLRFEEWTKKAFQDAGWSCHLQPLIWHKSDNKGIIADVQCGFRNVCEYALFFVRGRKAVVKNISNLYSGPTSKKFHASEKPLPMLEHFFSGLCDKYSRVLDPTCGSGTAVMTAQKFGAESALGLELNPEFAGKAQEWLRTFQLENQQPEIDLELPIF